MNGMLLAAGVGERMEPLSSVVAKPALEVLGMPLLTSAYRHLEMAGCDRIVVNLHRHPRQVAAAARMAARRVPPLFSWEPTLLGGAGGVAAARCRFGAGPVLIANADVWTDLDLSVLPNNPRDDEIVLLVMPHPDPLRWGSIRCAAGGRVTGIVPAGSPDAFGGFHFTGFQVLGARVVADLQGKPADMRTVWERLRSAGKLRAVETRGRWREAGTPAAYRELVSELLGKGSWHHPSASLDDTAASRVSAIGADCSVASGAVLNGCVLTAGARVGAGATLARCVIAGPVLVPTDSQLADVLIVPERQVPLTSPRAITR